MLVKHIAVLVTICDIVLMESDCSGPKMSLTSDNPRKTCTKIMASKNIIEYSCGSLIESFKKPLIKYCPVETCLKNGTWTKPSISCAMTECYVQGFSKSYIGHRMCTVSGRPCQRWDKQEPHRHRFKNSDMFPDFSISIAEGFCRDPNGSKGAPWCLTTDPDKKWEFCGVKMCSMLEVHDKFCGPPSVDDEDEYYDDYFSSSTVESTSTTLTPVVTTLKSTMRTSTNMADDDVIRPVCGNDVIFKTQKGVGLKSKPFLKVSARSTLECSALCLAEDECETFSYSKDSKMCHFHDNLYLETRKKKGSKIGMKTCRSRSGLENTEI